MKNSESNNIHWKHHESQLWTRFGAIFLGLWLLMSPQTWGYLFSPLRISDWISGALLIIFGLIALKLKYRNWMWGVFIVGLWLQIAPLFLWAETPAIYLGDTIIGMLAIALTLLVPQRPKELELGPEIPPNWSYNPSSWQQRIPVILFATIAWFLSRYLAVYQLHYTSNVWDPFFGSGSEQVITSDISEKFPVSDAGLGALVYSLEAVLGPKGGPRRWHTMPWTVFVFGLLVVPAGFVSIVLIMLQPIAVGAWCGICLLIAVCMLIMLALTVDEVTAVLQFLAKTRREGKPFWKTFFLGSNYAEKVVDVRTPSFHSSLKKNIKSMFWGVTIPWNLVVTLLLGVWLLFANNIIGYDSTVSKISNGAGALIVTLSIISFAEVIRSLRYINIILALIAAIATWIFPSTLSAIINNWIVAVLVIIFSLPRGKIKEHYGHWNKYIF